MGAGILEQLGVNWRLLLTQGVNFFILLAALTILVYRPLLKVMEERRKRIEFGLKSAEEAEQHLAAIEREKDAKLAAADRTALGIVVAAEGEAKKHGQDIITASHKKAEALLKEAEAMAERRRQEEFEELAARANALVRAAIAKTVELDPKAIDEKLVEQAVELIKKEI